VTGLNFLIDEVKLSSRVWAPAPAHVSIALTNACELNCPYCYAPKISASLSFDSVARWVRELDSNGCLGVGFGGGEPTLHPDFEKICRYTATTTGLSVTFTTHGHRLTDALNSGLNGFVHFVRISMDGVGETYERLRGRSFSELTARINAVRKFIPFGINFVVNSNTLPDLDLAARLAAKLGAREFLLLPENPVRGRDGIDPSTLSLLQNWINNYRGPVPLVISESAAAILPGLSVLRGEAGLRGYAHIDSQGVLRRSSYDFQGTPITSEGVLKALSLLKERCGEDTL